MNKPDAVVIGAGIAGLTAAAYLAKAGYKVLVCEQARQVGGLFNSFRREGYAFDGGIKAVESSGMMLPMLAQLGLLERLQLEKSPVGLILDSHFHRLEDMSGVEAYFTTLTVLYPHEERGLKRILTDLRTICGVMGALLSFPNPLFVERESSRSAQTVWFAQNRDILKHAPRIIPLAGTSLRSYLERRVHDPGLVSLLSELFPDGTSAFFGLGYFYMFRDYYYPRGGVRAIPDVLAAAIVEWGGEILLNARVEQILVEGGRAAGIRLEDGREFRTNQVLAAGDLRRTFTCLLPAEASPSRFVKKLLKAGPSHTVFNVFLGLDMPVEELNLPGCQHFFYLPKREGVSEEDRLSRPDYFTRVPQEISVPCLRQPGLAPPGKTGMNLSAMTSWDYLGGWDPRSPDYARRKDQYAAEMIASLEQFWPGLSERIELCFVGTPATIQAHSLNLDGAIMGWSYDRRKTLKRHGILSMEKNVHSPLPGLYLAGHWAFSPGGSPVAVLTGKLAADQILKEG